MARMLMKSIFTFGAVLVSAAIFAQAQPAAQKPAAPQTKQKAGNVKPSDSQSEAERPERTYLAKFHALDVCERLQAENLELIRILHVITTNYKSQYADWESDFKKIYEGYKVATDLYYKREVIDARVKYEENRKAIFDFYKKISVAYQKQCDDLMDKCSNVLLEKTLGNLFTNNSDDQARRATPEENKLLFKNKMRVRIAYGQIDDAGRAIRDGYPQQAVSHLRIAKSYAVRILEDLDEKTQKNQYDIHKADSLNRVLSKGASSVPASTAPASQNK